MDYSQLKYALVGRGRSYKASTSVNFDVVLNSKLFIFTTLEM